MSEAIDPPCSPGFRAARLFGVLLQGVMDEKLDLLLRQAGASGDQDRELLEGAFSVLREQLLRGETHSTGYMKGRIEGRAAGLEEARTQREFFVEEGALQPHELTSYLWAAASHDPIHLFLRYRKDHGRGAGHAAWISEYGFLPKTGIPCTALLAPEPNIPGPIVLIGEI